MVATGIVDCKRGRKRNAPAKRQRRDGSGRDKSEHVHNATTLLENGLARPAMEREETTKMNSIVQGERMETDGGGQTSAMP